jgi:DNA polymerase-3 subunit alpha
VGNTTVNAIIEARKEGPFKSFFDFAERLEQGAVNKRVLESLIGAGALDSLRPAGKSIHEGRAQLHAAVDPALAQSARAKRNRVSGQNDLFGSVGEVSQGPDVALPEVKAWAHGELLSAEKNAIGFYITGHPLDNYSDVLKELAVPRVTDLCAGEGIAKVCLGGVVSDLQVRTTKKGSRFGLLRLEDQTGGLKCVAWPEVFARYEGLLQNDLAVLITGRLEASDNGGAALIAEEVTGLSDVIQRKARAVIVRLPRGAENDLGQLFTTLDRHRGDCEVLLEMYLEDGVLVRARTHGTLRVQGSTELERALQQSGYGVEWSNVTFRH